MSDILRKGEGELTIFWDVWGATLQILIRDSLASEFLILSHQTWPIPWWIPSAFSRCQKLEGISCTMRFKSWTSQAPRATCWRNILEVMGANAPWWWKKNLGTVNLLHFHRLQQELRHLRRFTRAWWISISCSQRCLRMLRMSLVAPPLQAQGIAWEERSRRTRANVKPLLSQRNVACRCRNRWRGPGSADQLWQRRWNPSTRQQAPVLSRTVKMKSYRKSWRCRWRKPKHQKLMKRNDNCKKQCVFHWKALLHHKGIHLHKGLQDCQLQAVSWLHFKEFLPLLRNVHHMHQKNQIYGIQRLELKVVKVGDLKCQSPIWSTLSHLSCTLHCSTWARICDTHSKQPNILTKHWVQRVIVMCEIDSSSRPVFSFPRWNQSDNLQTWPLLILRKVYSSKPQRQFLSLSGILENLLHGSFKVLRPWNWMHRTIRNPWANMPLKQTTWFLGRHQTVVTLDIFQTPPKKASKIKVVVSSKKSPFFQCAVFFWGVVAGINCETEPMCCSLELDGGVDLYI